jgi:hypothetical protein
MFIVTPNAGDEITQIFSVSVEEDAFTDENKNSNLNN